MTAAPRRHGMLVLGALFLLSGAACQDPPAENEGGDTRVSTAAADILAATQDAATSTGASAGPAVSLGPPAAPPSGQEAPDIASLGYDQGSTEAPVRVVEFSDYGCSFCRKFHMETWPTLQEEYVETGKVLWKTVPFVIGNWASSLDASLGGECALEQGKAERMTELLFERQAEWKGASDPAPPVAAIAEAAGLDMAPYRTCVDEAKYLWRVQAHTSLARQAGVRGTPTFFVVGYAPVQGALPLELFREILDTVLVEAGAAGR
jgi:protein-disulfide isomerase